MTPEQKLMKAIELVEDEDMEIDSKPITFTFRLNEKEELKKPPLGIKPFDLWIEQRQEELWEAIKRSEHYPEDFINEWSFLDEMRREWKFRNDEMEF